MSADRTYGVFQWVLRPIFTWYFKIQIVGMEAIPKTGPVVVICNHVSGFDPPVVASWLPRPVYFMTKAELFRIRPFAYLIRTLHAYPVKRGTPDRQSLRYSLELLRRGETLLIFPEGHRTSTGDLQPIRSGTVFLGKHSDAWLVPVGIVGRYGFRGGIRYYVGDAFKIPSETTTKEAQGLISAKIKQQIERGQMS